MDSKKFKLVDDLDEYTAVTSKTFKRGEDFYAFYNSYAYYKGFSIRRKIVKKDEYTDEVIWRRYVCSNEGSRRAKYFGRSDKKRNPRGLTRCFCDAKLEVKLCKESGKWYVSDFVEHHSHPLAKPEHKSILRSHRGLKDHQKYKTIELGLGGLCTCQIMDVMEKNHGGPDDMGFLLQDLYNFFARLKKERVEGRDAEYVVNYMQAKQNEDSEFFYKYNLDGEGRLENLFWSDSQSQLDYGVYGDVIVFDSTYRVNGYNLAFVPFVGVDHHRNTVVFGCGIISDETIPSYEWLLEAFLEAMSMKHPESVITDGDAAMVKAIENVMPGTDHRLCSWLLTVNFYRTHRSVTVGQFKTAVWKAKRMYLRNRERVGSRA